MTLCYPIVLSVKASSSLILDHTKDFLQADIVASQRLIRKLIYFSFKTKPDIAFVVG